MKENAILSKAVVGFEFEFFSDIKEKNLVKILSDATKRKVHLGDGSKKGTPKKDKLVYHSGIKPDYDNFKLEKDFSGGPMMYEFITGPVPYYESSLLLVKILDTIKSIGWTNDLSGIHINISFAEKDLEIHRINIPKFCLQFKPLEEKIFKCFPSRKDNIYTESITRILPDFSSVTDNIRGTDIRNAMFDLPVNDSRYYGVNFKNAISKNYLEFRYIGGQDYPSKKKQIIELFEEFILYTHYHITNPEFEKVDEILFNKILEEDFIKLQYFKNYETFSKQYPEIKISSDLRYDKSIIDIRFQEMKQMLFNLTINCNVRKGYLNYDSDSSTYQVKEMIINGARNLQNLDIVLSECYGVFSNCNFYGCKIHDSIITDSNVFWTTDCVDSKLINVNSVDSVKFDRCFMRNEYSRYYGDFEECIIVGDKSSMSENSRVSKNCLYVDSDFSKDSKNKK